MREVANIWLFLGIVRPKFFECERTIQNSCFLKPPLFQEMTEIAKVNTTDLIVLSSVRLPDLNFTDILSLII